MAKDDYFVVVYQILAYLYQQLKRGEPIDPIQISNEGGKYIMINERYWFYIMSNLLKDGYVTGIECKTSVVGERIISLERCQITPKGIEYLTDNSTLSKAKDFFKEVKDIIMLNDPLKMVHYST